MTAPELKPCPFCGGTDLYWPHGTDPAIIQCGGKDGCGARSGVPDDQNETEAIAAWNRRADLAAVQPAQVRVNTLTWDVDGRRLRMDDTMSFSKSYNWDGYECLRQEGYGLGANYIIWPASITSKTWNLYGTADGLFVTDLNGEEAAKAAAQADYEARIPAALEPQPDPRDEVIARLVEALTIAANRLQRCAVDYDTGSHEFIETSEWAQEARAALAAAKAVQK